MYPGKSVQLDNIGFVAICMKHGDVCYTPLRYNFDFLIALPCSSYVSPSSRFCVSPAALYLGLIIILLEIYNLCCC